MQVRERNTVKRIAEKNKMCVNAPAGE